METANSIMLRGLTSSSCQPADFVSKSLGAGLSCPAPEALHDVPVRTAGGSAGLDTAREIRQKFYKTSRPCRKIFTTCGVRTRLPNEGGRLMAAIGDGAPVDDRVTGRVYRLEWS
jgi:hypothetical protein